MPDSTIEPESVAGGYDGWAVLNLESATIIQANEWGQELLGISEDQLPISLGELLPASDISLLTNRVLPVLRNADQWQGALRLGGSDLAPSPVLFVPHLGGDDGMQPGFASLLFASNDAAGAAALVPDPLTGLATRSALFRRLDQAVRRNAKSQHLLGTFFVDLDGLKKVNDRYGHEVGDTALIETAQRISSCVPEGALVVRFGGDEFVIVHEKVIDTDHALAFANEIVRALNEVGDYHAISASIGVALSRTGEVDSHELIRRSDEAMYRAKARGGSQACFFDADMRRRQESDEALRTSLLDAISSNGFGVAAQPMYELATGRICGVEFFIRLRDDSPYIANANQLFRLAHEYGEAFDAAVLDRALALAQIWQRAFGVATPRLQINVSTQSMAASAFAERVELALVEHRVRPRAIAFEIDSQDLAAAGDRERRTLHDLRTLGVPLVVDGFGTDALSLPDLAEWAPAMVKIAAADHPRAVTAGLVRGVSALRIPAVLKGIGTVDDLTSAVSIGAYGGQGNELTPVRRIEHIDALLHGPPRIGF